MGVVVNPTTQSVGEDQNPYPHYESSSRFVGIFLLSDSPLPSSSEKNIGFFESNFLVDVIISLRFLENLTENVFTKKRVIFFFSL